MRSVQRPRVATSMRPGPGDYSNPAMFQTCLCPAEKDAVERMIKGHAVLLDLTASTKYSGDHVNNREA